MKTKNTNRKRRLSIKFLMILLCMGILIYAGVLIVGRIVYDHSIKEHYDTVAYYVAETVKEYFPDGTLTEYAKQVAEYQKGKIDKSALDAIENSEDYKRILSQMASLRSSFEANDIFVITVDMDVLKAYTPEGFEARTWNPLCYIADVYEVEEDRFYLGDVGTILPEYRESLFESHKSGKRYDGFYISEAGFGYNMTAILPITDGGETVAFVGVEIPMKTLNTSIRNFVLWISLITGIVVIFSLLISAFLAYKFVIAPIKLSASEARNFVSNNTQVSDKLKSIQTGDEIQVLSESILHMEIGINEYIEDVKALTSEKERIGAELNVATTIQADMLPTVFPDRKEYTLYATMDPAKEVGGDFYDFFHIDDNHLGLVMADVSGKGVPAALFMVIAKTLIKNRALMGGTPSEVLSYANEQLCEGNGAELFVTVWFAIIDLTTGKGIAANAGHEHPVLKRAGGQFELVVYRHSPAVATMEGMKFREHEFELHPGDTLYVYTDGVPEATNAENELFGTDRMLEVMNKHVDATPQELLPIVREGIDAFVKDAPQFDDITMLGITYFGKQDDKE